MDKSEFKHEILNGDEYEYVSEEALVYFQENAEYQVINRSALKKDAVDQTEFISIAFPKSGDEYSDAELINKIKETIVDGNRDIQKYQLRDAESMPNTIEVWRHGNGVSAFAFAE